MDKNALGTWVAGEEWPAPGEEEAPGPHYGDAIQSALALVCFQDCVLLSEASISRPRHLLLLHCRIVSTQQAT